MDIVRAVFVTLAVLGVLGLATSDTLSTSTSTASPTMGLMSSDGGTPLPPVDGKAKR